jgi:hypothetical protein
MKGKRNSHFGSQRQAAGNRKLEILADEHWMGQQSNLDPNFWPSSTATSPGVSPDGINFSLDKVKSEKSWRQWGRLSLLLSLIPIYVWKLNNVVLKDLD